MHIRSALRGLAVLAALVVALPAVAQSVVGEVVSVTEGARLDRDGQRFRLAPEVSILSGDTIVTNGTGTVQLLFRDDTRVVVGPDSQFVASDIRMRRSGRASRFTVATVGGTFRFLSGDSARRVYDIRTPTATLGVRGTEFDFALDRSRNTAMATFDGEVQMCGAGRCFGVSGSCATIRASARGVDPRPIEADAQIALLARQFPFTQSQGGLGEGFRTNLAGCNDNDPNPGPLRPVVVREIFAGERATRPDDDDDAPADTGGGEPPRSGG